MTWFRVDDRLHDHRKARKAGTQAMGVWLMAGSWSAANLTDGFIPADILTRWGTKRDADKLVKAGLWYVDVNDGEEGWRFHDWLHYQPDARTIRLRQEAESAAGSLGNHRRWHSKRGVVDPECEHCDPSGSTSGKGSGTRSGSQSGQPIAPESPVPARPVLTKNSSADASESDFDEFWIRYPRKVAKGAAHKAWKTAAKKVDDTHVIIDASRRFAARVQGSDEKFIPHASTWLNAERWLDDDTEPQAEAVGGWHRPGGPPPAPPEVADDPVRFEKWLADWRRENRR